MAILYSTRWLEGAGQGAKGTTRMQVVGSHIESLM